MKSTFRTSVRCTYQLATTAALSAPNFAARRLRNKFPDTRSLLISANTGANDTDAVDVADKITHRDSHSCTHKPLYASADAKAINRRAHDPTAPNTGAYPR